MSEAKTREKSLLIRKKKAIQLGMHQIPYMKRANEHEQGVIDVAQSNGEIHDAIGGHLEHVRCKKL
jgi:hypothetical protein